MVDLVLIALGIVLLLYSLWLEYVGKSSNQGFDYLVEQEQKIHTMSVAVDKAKRDVSALLAEVDRSSEQVVEEFEAWMQRIGNIQSCIEKEGQGSEQKPSKDTARSNKQVNKNKNQINKNLLSSGNNDRYHEVIQLADTGKTVDEIAQIVKIGKGEISLILGLRGKGE